MVSASAWVLFCTASNMTLRRTYQTTFWLIGTVSFVLFCVIFFHSPAPRHSNDNNLLFFLSSADSPLKSWPVPLTAGVVPKRFHSHNDCTSSQSTHRWTYLKKLLRWAERAVVQGPQLWGRECWSRYIPSRRRASSKQVKLHCRNSRSRTQSISRSATHRRICLPTAHCRRYTWSRLLGWLELPTCIGSRQHRNSMYLIFFSRFTF